LTITHENEILNHINIQTRKNMKYMSLCIALIGLFPVRASFTMERNSSVSQYGLLTVCNLTAKVVHISYPSHLTTQTMQSSLPTQLADRLRVDMSRKEKVVVALSHNRHIAFPMINKWQAVGVSETKYKDGRYAEIHMLDELGQRQECLGYVRLTTNAKTKKRSVTLSIIDEDEEDRKTTWLKCDSPKGINPNPFKTTPNPERPRTRKKSFSLT
jgi:hypothetical protein